MVLTKKKNTLVTKRKPSGSITFFLTMIEYLSSFHFPPSVHCLAFQKKQIEKLIFHDHNITPQIVIFSLFDILCMSNDFV